MTTRKPVSGETPPAGPDGASDEPLREGPGYHQLPATTQFSPGPAERVDETRWRPCDQCGRPTPVSWDLVWVDGSFQATGTVTYVCAHCDHAQVDKPRWSDEARQQRTCHECGAELGPLFQCPTCSFPRGWKRVPCPYCATRQPVEMAHWVRGCDMFTMSCVRCERTFYSLCTC
jgi:hypothetical protein